MRCDSLLNYVLIHRLLLRNLIILGGWAGAGAQWEEILHQLAAATGGMEGTSMARIESEIITNIF